MSARPSPGPSQPSQPTHARVKYAPGIQAGAQEEKYRQKARTLKKKIREIEAENDKVYAKTLQAKRNIQRLRIERAILYERLSGQPPSPRVSYAPPVNHYPPATAQPPPSQPQPPPLPAHVAYPPSHEVQVDLSDLAAVDYYSSQGIQIRRAVGPDGLPIHVVDVPNHTSGPPVAAPPSASPVHPSRHSAYRDSRHSHLPSIQPSAPGPLQVDVPRSHERHEHRRTHSTSHPHSPTDMVPQSHHSRSRSHSRGHHGPTSHASAYHPQRSPLDTLPPSYHEPHEYAPSERRVHDYTHVQAPASRGRSPPAPYHPHPELSPTSPHGSSRIHNHQRMGPGTNINNIGQPELEGVREHRDRERIRDWEAEQNRRSRERSSMAHARAPSPPYSAREREAYAHRSYEGTYARPPLEEPSNGSRSGSTHAIESSHYYEREYDQVRSTAPTVRYSHSGQSDIGAAEVLHRVRSGSTSRAAERYSSGGRSGGSDVEMEEQTARA